MPEPKKDLKKVLCPDCETEVTINDEDSDCPKCGLDLGRILIEIRREDAKAKIRAGREAVKEEGRKKSKMLPIVE